MVDHIANIGDVGARRRRTGGWIWAGVSVIAFVALLTAHSPRWCRLLLVIPIALAALGFLQARTKT